MPGVPSTSQQLIKTFITINAVMACLIVLSGCISLSTRPQTVTKVTEVESRRNDDSAVCEVMYAAHPHKKAVAAIGAHRLNATQHFNFEQMTAFSKQFMPLTRAIADNILKNTDRQLQVIEQELVLGGYEGESIPSVVLRVSVANKADYKSLLRMAAHIGYVYAQDSILVVCPDKPLVEWQKSTSIGDWKKSISVNVVDQGRETFLTDKNIPLLFGMMIGAFNGPQGLGYTFYKDSKIFSTLSESGREPGEEVVIERLAQWITTLSNGEVKFHVSKKTMWIFFPNNDWKRYPQGENYQRYMMQGEVSERLKGKRQRYLNELDSFLDSVEDYRYRNNRR